MKKAVLALAAVAVIILAAVYHKRLFQDDEKRIREIVVRIEQAAENKNTDGIMEHVSGEYSDDSGLNKLLLRRLLDNNLARVDELRVKVEDADVFITGEKATVNLKVTAEAVRQGRIFFPLGSENEAERPEVTFKKTGTGEWKIVKIENMDSGPSLRY